MSVLMVELVGIFLAAAFFVLRYGTSRPWWRTRAGIAIFTSSVGLMLLAAAFILQAWTEIPDLAFEVIAGVVLLGALFKAFLVIQDDWRRWRRQ